jgi:hypothetical protein
MPHFNLNAGPQERPLRRPPNDRLPNISGTEQLILCFITCFYSGIHIFGWHFKFATAAEKYLWRASSLTHLFATWLFWVIDRHQSWERRGHYALAWTYIILPFRWKHIRRASSPSARCSAPEMQAEEGGSMDVLQQRRTESAATLLGMSDGGAVGATDDHCTKRPAPTAVQSVDADGCTATKSNEVSYSSTAFTITANDDAVIPNPKKSSTATTDDVVEKLEGYEDYVVPMYKVVFMTTVTLCYTIARIYLLVEIFLAFRALPVEQYADVDWATLIPHI